MDEEILLIDAPGANESDYVTSGAFEVSGTTPFVIKNYERSAEDDERIIIIAVIMVCTIVGNAVLMFMLLGKRTRRIKRVNVFLINLAIGDIAVALVTNSTEILFLVFGDWTLGPVACKISVYLQIVTIASATFLLTAMSIDRYQVIVKPMQTLASRPRIWLKIAVAWTMAFIFALPQLAIFVLAEDGVRFDGAPKRKCKSLGYQAQWQRMVYFTFLTTYILLIPACVMLYCYSKIISVVWSRAATEQHPANKTCSLYGKGHGVQRSLAGSGQDSPRISVRRGLVTASKRRAVVMTLTVIIGFLVCLTPYFLISLIRIYSHYRLPLQGALYVSESIFMTHSALNPVLYGIFTLRPKHLKRIRNCLTCRNRRLRKPSEKNRLINGGSHHHGRKEGKAKPDVATDLVTENTHALKLLKKSERVKPPETGYANSLDAKSSLCSQGFRKYERPETWLASRKLGDGECLSTV